MAQSQPDLSTWLSEDQVSNQLGISSRQLRRERSENRWNTRERTRPGRKPEVVYNPAEVEARMPPPVQTLMKAAPAPTHLDNPAPTSGLSAELAGLPPITWPAIIDLVESLAQRNKPADPTLYVRLDEASRITGLTVAYLKRLIKAGSLRSIKDIAIKVRRTDLAEMDPTAPAPSTKAEAKVKAEAKAKAQRK